METAPVDLTPRELEVLTLVAEGLENHRIAKKLGISYHTAKYHVQNACSKLGDGNRVLAVATAMRRGILK